MANTPDATIEYRLHDVNGALSFKLYVGKDLKRKKLFHSDLLQGHFYHNHHSKQDVGQKSGATVFPELPAGDYLVFLAFKANAGYIGTFELLQEGNEQTFELHSAKSYKTVSATNGFLLLEQQIFKFSIR